MMGCLTLPFRMLGCLVMLALLAAGWLYRDRIVGEGRRLLGLTPPAAAVAEPGRASRADLRDARTKIGRLRGGAADSVVLTPDEMASLLVDGLGEQVRRQLDSVTVELGADEVEVGGLLSTARLPKELIGPLAVALRDRERVVASGTVRVVAPGRAEWTVQRLRVRDFPFPRDVVPRIMARAVGDSTRRSLPVRLPPGVRDLRVEPGRVILYGAVDP
jgi:hypothetical protein